MSQSKRHARLLPEEDSSLAPADHPPRLTRDLCVVSLIRYFTDPNSPPASAGSTARALQRQHQTQPHIKLVETVRRQPTDALGEDCFVKSKELRNVDD